MIKFIICDLPQFLSVDWIQALLVILSIFSVIGFAVAQFTLAEKLRRSIILFHKIVLLSEAGFHRLESPLWFALGP